MKFYPIPQAAQLQVRFSLLLFTLWSKVQVAGQFLWWLLPCLTSMTWAVSGLGYVILGGKFEFSLRGGIVSPDMGIIIAKGKSEFNSLRA